MRVCVCFLVTHPAPQNTTCPSTDFQRVPTAVQLLDWRRNPLRLTKYQRISGYRCRQDCLRRRTDLPHRNHLRRFGPMAHRKSVHRDSCCRSPSVPSFGKFVKTGTILNKYYSVTDVCVFMFLCFCFWMCDRTNGSFRSMENKKKKLIPLPYFSNKRHW